MQHALCLLVVEKQFTVFELLNSKGDITILYNNVCTPIPPEIYNLPTKTLHHEEKKRKTAYEM